MTLIVAVKYKNGVAIASDSRTTYGEAPLMREEPQKMEKLGKNVVLTGSGFSGALDKLLDNVRSSISSKPMASFKDIANECENIIWAFYEKYKKRYEEDEDLEFPTWILATHNRILRIFPVGITEEERSYTCEGSGRPYGEYILQQRFEPDISKEDAVRLVAYAILQTSRIDPSVGGKISIALIESFSVRNLSEEEVNAVLEDLAEAKEPSEKELEKIVYEIVEKRRWINTAFKGKFNFELFVQNEFAISKVQKGCRNESDFTHRISALSLLIDGLNVSSLNKLISTHPEGSISVLETFLKEKYKGYEEMIIANLREIKVLRSKKMPIHKDDPKILQVILTWGCKIPPNWSSLWLEAVKKYMESITSIEQILRSK